VSNARSARGSAPSGVPASGPPTSVDTAQVANTSASDAHSESTSTSRVIARCGLGAFAVQLLGFGALSVFRYQRFNLGTDFAIYSQAWTQIGRGHLSPQLTVYGFSFLRSNAELITWPLALFYPMFRSPIFLLWLQDAALVGTSCVSFVWLMEFLQRRAIPAKPMLALGLGSLLVLLINPETYATAALDFHFEPLVALFAVLAARDLWNGRPRRPWLWLGLCLLCGDVGGLVVVGVGLSAMLASRSTRRAGVLAVVIGVGWVSLISLIGANQGATLRTGYAYLAARQTLPAGFAGGVAVAAGLIAHPGRPAHMLISRRSAIYTHLRPVGVVGVLSPWGFGVPFITLLSATLQHSSTFIVTAFQNVTVFPFVLFGTVSLLVAVSAVQWKGRPVGTLVALVAGLALLANGAVNAIERLPDAPKANATAAFVSASEAGVLRHVLAQTRRDAEVVASVPIVGRFAQRTYVYQYLGPAQQIPIHAADVVVILDIRHTLQIATAAQATAAFTYLVAQHAQVLVNSDDVLAVEWHPPEGTKNVQLP
jgi:hypothetical protein